VNVIPPSRNLAACVLIPAWIFPPTWGANFPFHHTPSGVIVLSRLQGNRMRRIGVALGVVVIAVAVMAVAQRPAQNSVPRFEVFSMRQSIPDRNVPVGARGGVGGGSGGCKGSSPQIDPGRIGFSNNSLYTLIAWAYGLDCRKAKAYGLVSGGPT